VPPSPAASRPAACQVLGLAREQADHALALEQAARIALADKLGEIGREQHVEDGVRLGISQRLHHAAGVHLAQRCGLLGDNSTSGCAAVSSFLNVATADWPYS
jgi:hypothetical protein